MHLQIVAVLLTAGWAHVQAAALPGPPFHNSSLVLLHTRILDNGRLEYWGEPPAESAATSVFDWDAGWGDADSTTYDPAAFAPAAPARRCGSSQYHCSDVNLADANACAWLVKIFAENPGGRIDPNVRGVIHHRDSGSCVFSWHDHVPGMVNGYLIAAGRKVLWGCGLSGNGRVSGYATDVSLNGVCTIQCVSSARGCF